MNRNLPMREAFFRQIPLTKEIPDRPQRAQWIDCARGACCFLVVLGHTGSTSIAEHCAAFRVPLFFFLAGYLLRESDVTKLRDRTSRRATHLYKSYLQFSVVSYVFWLLITRPFGNEIHQRIPAWKPFVGIFYGIGDSNWMPQNVALWFLPALICTELIASQCIASLKRKDAGRLAVVILLCATALLVGHSLVRLPLSFDSAVLALPFYLMGYAGRSVVARVRSERNFIVCGAVSVAIFTAISFSIQRVGRFDIAALYCGRIPMLTYLQGGLGIIAMILLSKTLLPAKQAFALVGRKSLLILGYHNLIDTLLRGIFVRILGQEFHSVQCHLLATLAFSAFNVAATLVICCCLLPHLRVSLEFFRFRTNHLNEMS